MRICVFGAGAVGGLLAVRLAGAGNDVAIVARGEHLDAIQTNGLTLLAGEEQVTRRVRASTSAADLGEQDTVLITTKATVLASLPAAIAPLLGGSTSVVFVQNGIPWWYAIGPRSPCMAPPDLSFMDPDGDLRALSPRTIGAVVYGACEVVCPGVVRNGSAEANLFLGELDDAQSDRVRILRAAFEASGIRSPQTPAIRRVVWSKLMLNMTGSLLCAVTGQTIAAIRSNPAFAAILDRLYAEATAVARAYCPEVQIDARPRAKVGHKPSILQDYERGRPMEIDALVTAPLAFARAAGLATPTLDFLGVLITDKAVRAGLHSPGQALPI